MRGQRKSDSAMVRAHLIDAMGGGFCSKHGAYFGHGKHGLRACPYCDINAYHKRKKHTPKQKKQLRRRRRR